MSTEFICKLLPLVGLGTREYIKAGHAALVLIENKTGAARYFDFGRYVTPAAHGRVRGANTDAELEIPFTAQLKECGELENLSEFLLWLDAHPQKTHGEGRLLASVCNAIDYHKAEEYISSLQRKGSIRYGAFEKTGSNCSRFVTEAILAATEDRKIIKALSFNKKFTPSTVGNVEKAALDRLVFEVFEGVINPFRGSAFRENLTNYFHKKKAKVAAASKDALVENVLCPSAQQLRGKGSSAWFQFIDALLPKHHFRIKRYNDLGEVDFDGVYFSEEFNANQNFTFIYDSHCAFCHVLQQDRKVKLTKVATYAAFNLIRMVHSA